ncbi:MAG: hypothetical protein N3D82_03210 [Ignisphaera sp.]|nr:hypothetical protein [Ignisphaera sp.]MCX8168018.1 hypothetical protein [Ignisphaera sp.]MDW8085511.1 hypothetical protein [Ignisphaera sp.]
MILSYIKEKGKATDKELYETVKKMHELSYQQFISLLMALEVEGFIELHYSKDLMIIVPKIQHRHGGVA